MTKQQANAAKPGSVDIETALPPKQRDKRFDGYLKTAGFGLAVVSFVLPFVMYYDILDARPKPEASGIQVRDPLNRANQKVVRETRGKIASTSPNSSEELDPMTTATTSELTADRFAKMEDASKQPFPGKPQFLVREVVGGLVMIEDETGYWFVEKGSPLPDGSTLVAIQRGTAPGSWNIKTSDGTVIDRTF